MLLTSACSKDDEEYMLSANDLEQTTWKAVYTGYDYQGKKYKYNYIVQFLFIFATGRCEQHKAHRH